MEAPLPLSVAIITLNEEENLPRCLAAVRDLAAEIVIVDCGSTDGTAAIAAKFQARFIFNEWPGYVAQKNLALQRCTQPWVLCVDADEEVSPELGASIRQALTTGSSTTAGYYINRRTFYLGDWIWHAWYPEWRLRLVRRDRAEWRGYDPHDKLTVTGPTGRLAGDLLHYSYRDLNDHFQRTIKYARITAESYVREGRRLRWHHLLLSPIGAVLRSLIIKQAWRDGWRGWLIAGATGFKVFAKYAFLLEGKLTKPS